MRKLLSLHISVLFALAAIGCKQRPDAFTYLTAAQSGIHFENTVTNSEELNILNYLYFYNGAGVAAADLNNDGLTDLYFTANQQPDRVYLNKGNMQFREVTSLTGIDNSTPWTTGVTTADIDNNGYTDLYICKVAPLSPEGTHNLLFLNLGPDENGVPQFREAAATYGLDFSGYSTQAAFFDQDADGDLDMFLLNHSVHPNQSYGRGSLRDQTDSLSGDRFYRNHNGKYINESEAAGIHTGKIGYGLGISIGDVNADGAPDIYIGNDFFENDYLYINQGDGTFKDLNTTGEALGHTSHFSMGNDIADIDNDLQPDIVSVDMLPEDLNTYKTSGLEYPYQIYQNYLRNGYRHQYMQNTLHLNAGNEKFKETAYLSGIAASEWSWSPLLEDLDNDGFKDLFITNGIPGATNDMDFVSFIANEEIQKQLGSGMGSDELAFIDKLPVKRTANYLFRNRGDKTFYKDPKWNQHPPSFSNGAVLADLDNDHDLDLVVNNSNEPAFIIRNDLNTGNGITINLKGPANNIKGIGARVVAYTAGNMQLGENYTSGGYLSAQPAKLHFGLGKAMVVDSVRVWWPDNTTELRTHIEANTAITLHHHDALQGPAFMTQPAPALVQTDQDIKLEYRHKDQPSLEFNIDPLIPYASTNLGPRVSVGHINNDSLQDLILGGGKSQPASVYLQTPEGHFEKMHLPELEEDPMPEQTDQLLFDANGDGLNDLLLIAGGNEFTTGAPLQPKLYMNSGTDFTHRKKAFPEIILNASRVKAVDIDGDGDQDLLIGADLEPRAFGKTPKQYLLQNDGTGNFKDITDIFAPELRLLGNIRDFEWTDLNNDNRPDLIIAGHWMPLTVFMHTGTQLKLQKNNTLDRTNGWWNAVKVADFDMDGDMDIVAGNWGKNTRLTATPDQPLRLYRKDMDNNGSIESVITFYYQGIETPFASKDELSKQMPYLNKKYLSYADFARAGMNDLFGAEQLNDAAIKEVYELGSCYFENTGDGSFVKTELPFQTQTSVINDIAITDLNIDGFPDLILVGNRYEVSTQLGRPDSNRGTILLNDTKGNFVEAGNAGLSGAMTAIVPVTVKDTTRFMITRNNDTPIFLQPTNLKTNESNE
ncbi:VCBS repeat-containing protein [Robertkochia sediminum]|uniref:VCBS repeat-containing protein n=1 Tax=Robertkochia sediminum TaxID=2785326 RepID=UPI001932625A|nr:VCBS repeat-containing protein [Robertkochia sediminum]MBL7474012.1 VCBS repeat-containing protein [Robertkochia sediminum]